MQQLDERLTTYKQHKIWRHNARVTAKRLQLHEMRQQAQALEAEIEKDEKHSSSEVTQK